MFRKLRILILLFVLFLVGAGSWIEHARLTDWDEPIWVAVYPIAGDQSPRTRAYLRRLGLEHLRPIEGFMAEQGQRFGIVSRKPVKLSLARPGHELPPSPPENGSVLSVMYWSLRLRYWAWRNEDADLLGDVSLFVIYHDPAVRSSVPHSLGMKEGHIGVVHGFADDAMTPANNVVILHELLHTLGASDKYNPSNNLPVYPDGYAEPGREPLHPQAKAEIMAGRIPVSATQAAIPKNLRQTVLGLSTASEIGW
jgi:hypothetical protein